MSQKIEVKADLGRLNTVVRSIGDLAQTAVKVGILAAKNARKDKTGQSNASIGIVHEFGSYVNHIPERSFLRMPLQHNAKAMTQEIDRLAIGNLIAGDPMGLMKKVGVVAEGAIGEAFKTKGFGTWRPISKRTQSRKGSDAILIETSQLQRSITSAVVKRGST